jgi:hypothetical protein
LIHWITGFVIRIAACPSASFKFLLENDLEVELTRRSRIEVPRVDYEKLSGDRVGESAELIKVAEGLSVCGKT